MAPRREEDLPHHLAGATGARSISASSRRSGASVRRLDGQETLDGFYAELRRRGKAGGQPLSASTVRATSTWCCPGRYGGRWPGAGFTQPGPAGHPAVGAAQRRGPAPVEQVAGLLATALEATNPAGAVPAMAAVVLGARRGELCALRWHHVDLDRGEVLLERGRST